MSDLRRFKTSIASVKKRDKPSIAKTLARQAPRTVLGQEKETQNKGQESVFLTRKERSNHTHVIGGTGVGKSKIMELMLRRDVIDRRAGVCLIDPHGSLYDDLLSYVSERYPNHADRFVLFNPAEEFEHILGFNPMPSVEHTDYLLDSLISSCLKAWGQDNSDETPRITKWLENIFYTIIANDLTLVESQPLIQVNDFKNMDILLKEVGHSSIRDDWEMYKKAGINQRQSIIEGAANRLRKFLRSEIIRNVIGQQESPLNFKKVMDEGKVVLINLNGKDRISNDNAKLLGVMIVNEVFRCAKLRDPRDQRKKPFFFYIDEFANFVTRDIARSLEETRKFGLFLTLSHQHLAQLHAEDEYMYSSVMTNCKNKIVFGGLSHEDAELMMKEVSSGFMDLKQVKDEVESTKVRSRLEKRELNSWGSSESVTKSVTNTIANAVGKTFGKSGSESEGESDNDSFSHKYGDEASYNVGKTRSKQQTRGWSKSDSSSRTDSSSQGRSKTYGKNKGTSETWVSVPEEYKEVTTRSFWSLQDIQYMETAQIKNQGIAEAFVKVGNQSPRRIDVSRLKGLPHNPRTSSARLASFRQKVFKQGYYKPIEKVKAEFEKRQIDKFNQILNYGPSFYDSPGAYQSKEKGTSTNTHHASNESVKEGSSALGLPIKDNGDDNPFV